MFAERIVDTRNMAWRPHSPALTVIPCASWPARFASWLAAARSHRVICIVLGIWLLNGFDLTFTILTFEQGMLHEENPVARYILQYGTPSVVLFKIGLVLIGSYPLLRFRQKRVAELGAFTILAAYALLSVHWSFCFEQYDITASQSINFAGLHVMP
jgi:hypothetical protein